jgi:prolyl-tRNA editing enzyme YbaK/EbsC (Cys-tRNA(Pro) deacylase)
MDPIEHRVRETLAASEFPFELIDCDPALADTAEFCAAYGYSLEQSANTIVVASRRPRGINAACVVLAPTRLDVNRRVREVLDVKKLSFASPEATTDLTGMAMGGVTPIALPEGLPVLVDSRIMDSAWIIVGGGSRSLKVKLPTDYFSTLVAAQIVEDLAVVHGTPRSSLSSPPANGIDPPSRDRNE